MDGILRDIEIIQIYLINNLILQIIVLPLHPK